MPDPSDLARPALFDTPGKPAPPEVRTVRKWLDNWTGVEHSYPG